MGSKLAIALLAAATMVLARAAPLRAQAGPKRVVPVQPLLALAVNDLTFGTVLPGIPSSVSVRDPHHAGLFEIDGPADASVRVEFILPAALAASGGALLPISFGPGDGFADFSHGHPPRGTLFDPHAPVIGALGPNGRLFVRMGGTVLPGRPQAGGEYHATISMTVYDLGS
jgi:hypothetical protein